MVYLLIALLTAVFVLFLSLIAALLAWRDASIPVTCASFHTQSAAQKALLNHPSLDRNRDGIACNGPATPKL